MQRKSVQKLLVALVLIAACLAYANAIGGDFVWDDRTLILEDSQIRDARNLPRFFVRDFFSTHEDVPAYGYYRPLVTASYLVDLAVWGENATGFHLTNIACHGLACLFLFLFLRRRADVFIAFAASLLFALHPVHTESVAWIAGRTDVLCGLFLFASLYFWTVFRDSQRTRVARWRSLLALVAVLVCQLLALFAKEMALIGPFLIVLTDFVWNREEGGKPTGLLGRETILLFLPIAVYAALRFLVSQSAEAVRASFTISTLVSSFFSTVWLYAGKLFFPISLDAYIQNPVISDPMHPRVLAGLGIFTFCFVAVLIHKRRPAVAVAGGWFLLSLLPISNVIRLQTPLDMGFPAAERFLYIPSVAVCLILAAGLNGLFANQENSKGSKRKRAIAVVILVLVSVLFTIGTVHRNLDWQNDVVFFQKELESSPDAALLHGGLSEAFRRSDKPVEALPHAKRAKELAPTLYSKRLYANNLAGVYADLGELDLAERALNELGEGDVARASMAYNTGELARVRGDFEEALKQYDRALAVREDHLSSLLQSASCLVALGRTEEALKRLHKAVSVRPDDGRAFDSAGNIYKQLGQNEQAVQMYRQAVEREPGNGVYLSNLGVALSSSGHHEEAIEILGRALFINEGLINARTALALAHLGAGNLDQAEVVARSAVVQSPKNDQARLVLARVLIVQEMPLQALVEVDKVLAIHPEHFLALKMRKELEGLIK